MDTGGDELREEEEGEYNAGGGSKGERTFLTALSRAADAPPPRLMLTTVGRPVWAALFLTKFKPEMISETEPDLKRAG